MNFIHYWKYWIRPFAAIIYFIVLVIALPLCIVELTRKDPPDHVKAWFIGGVFTLLAVPISLWEILQHLIYYTQPNLQRHIIRILWMVPIYAMNAWLALRFPDAAIYLDTVRECYEAYVIYNFMAYLQNYLWTEHPQLHLVLENKPRVKHLIPFCCLPSWEMGSQMIDRCKHGVLQYTVIRPLTTIIALMCQLGGKYDEGDFNFTSAWSYLVIVNNISQIWAMYCLILFYKATKEELAPVKPVPKFLCVKFVVFFSFWQSVVIAALVKSNAIPVDGAWDFYPDIKAVATGIQDFLICIEMFLAAIAHYFSFSHKPFVTQETEEANCCRSFLSMWDISDVKDDVVEHVKVIGTTMKKTVSGQLRSRQSMQNERTPLLQDGDLHRASQSAPTINFTQADVHTQSQPDTQSVSTDWDGSSMDRFGESYTGKSTTASMNNYLEISSVEGGHGTLEGNRGAPVSPWKKRTNKSGSTDDDTTLRESDSESHSSVVFTDGSDSKKEGETSQTCATQSSATANSDILKVDVKTEIDNSDLVGKYAEINNSDLMGKPSEINNSDLMGNPGEINNSDLDLMGKPDYSKQTRKSASDEGGGQSSEITSEEASGDQSNIQNSDSSVVC